MTWVQNSSLLLKGCASNPYLHLLTAQLKVFDSVHIGIYNKLALKLNWDNNNDLSELRFYGAAISLKAAI